MEDFFFLKVWAKNMGAHYTWQNMVIAPLPILKNTPHLCLLCYLAFCLNHSFPRSYSF